jgi:murein endopeptidase
MHSSGEHFKQLRPSPMVFTPTMATIPLHSDHHVRLGLEAQLRQCWAMYSALPTEANRYQVVRLERLLLSL